MFRFVPVVPAEERLVRNEGEGFDLREAGHCDAPADGASDDDRFGLVAAGFRWHDLQDAEPFGRDGHGHSAAHDRAHLLQRLAGLAEWPDHARCGHAWLLAQWYHLVRHLWGRRLLDGRR